MTRDEIIKMAKEACEPAIVPAWDGGNEVWKLTQEEIERFAALVAEAEREACARMVTDCAWNLKGPEAAVAVEACAAAIRARGEK
jgi:hypothetical protein